MVTATRKTDSITKKVREQLSLEREKNLYDPNKGIQLIPENRSENRKQQIDDILSKVSEKPLTKPDIKVKESLEQWKNMTKNLQMPDQLLNKYKTDNTDDNINIVANDIKNEFTNHLFGSFSTSTIALSIGTTCLGAAALFYIIYHKKGNAAKNVDNTDNIYAKCFDVTKNVIGLIVNQAAICYNTLDCKINGKPDNYLDNNLWLFYTTMPIATLILIGWNSYYKK